MSFKHVHDKRRYASSIYSKLKKVCTKTELDMFDICKDEISKIMFQKDAELLNCYRYQREHLPTKKELYEYYKTVSKEPLSYPIFFKELKEVA